MKLYVIMLVAMSAVAAQAQLLHRYSMDENGGNLVFDSVGSVNGVTGSDTELTGSHLRLNLSDNPFNDNSYANWGTSIGQFGTANFGVSFRMRSTSVRTNQDLIGNRNEGSFGNYFSVRMANGGISAEICEDISGLNYTSIWTATAVNDGAWHTVLVARVGTSLDLWVDGIHQGTGNSSAPANIANGVDFQAGFSPISTIFGLAFTGDMDDVEIYGTVPEPASSLVLVFGLAILIVNKRARR